MYPIHDLSQRPLLFGRRMRWILVAVSWFGASQVRGAIVYSGVRNLSIPDNFGGVYLNVTSQQQSLSEFSGWDLNAFFGGLGIANSPAFQPIRVGTGAEDPITPIALGAQIGSGLVYASGYGGSGAEDDSGHLGPGALQFTEGQVSIIGFKMARENAIFYGWMKVTLTRDGTLGVIHDWAYDNSGAAIRAGAAADLGAAPRVVPRDGNVVSSAASAGTAILLDSGARFTFSETGPEGNFSGNIMGGGELKISGGGGIRLSGNNEFNGVASIDSGSKLIISQKGNIGTAALELKSSAALVFESLAANNGGNNTYTNAITITSQTGVLRNSGNGTVTLAGELSKNGSTLSLAGGAFEITGTISGSSANSDLLVDGASVTLSTANSYNGPTYIRNGGILMTNAAGALPSASVRSALIMDDSGTGSSQMKMSAANQSILSLTGAASSSINLSADSASHSLTMGDRSVSSAALAGSSSVASLLSAFNTLGLNRQDYSGVIAGSGGIIKDGGNRQVLLGSNSFTGSTVVSSGILQAAATGALGSTSSVQVSAGGMLVVSASDASNANASLTLNNAATRGLAFSGSVSSSFAALGLGSDSIIDLGDGSVNLHFANSSLVAWLNDSGLTIWNWSGSAAGSGVDQVYFGTSALGLSSSQLSRVRLYSDGGETLAGQAMMLSTGELTVVPESQVAWIFGSMVLWGLTRRRRDSQTGNSGENLGQSL